MTISLNNQNLDITFQNEKTAGDAVRSLSVWLGQNGFRILGITMDGKSCPPGGAWENMPVSAEVHMDIDAPLARELRQANIEILMEYLLHAKEALSSDPVNPGALRALSDSIAEVEPSSVFLNTDASRHAGSLEENLFRSVRDGIRDRLATGSFADRERLESHLGHLMLICQDRLKECRDPAGESAANIKVLRIGLADLAMASTHLMTGEGRKAFDSILRFSELLSRLLRLYWIQLEEPVPGMEVPFTRDELDQASTGVNGLLERISECLKDEDTISLGDILEYELPPEVEKLLALAGN